MSCRKTSLTYSTKHSTLVSAQVQGVQCQVLLPQLDHVQHRSSSLHACVHTAWMGMVQAIMRGSTKAVQASPAQDIGLSDPGAPVMRIPSLRLSNAAALCLAKGSGKPLAASGGRIRAHY